MIEVCTHSFEETFQQTVQVVQTVVQVVNVVQVEQYCQVVWLFGCKSCHCLSLLLYPLVGMTLLLVLLVRCTQGLHNWSQHLD